LSAVPLRLNNGLLAYDGPGKSLHALLIGALRYLRKLGLVMLYFDRERRGLIQLMLARLNNLFGTILLRRRVFRFLSHPFALFFLLQILGVPPILARFFQLKLLFGIGFIRLHGKCSGLRKVLGVFHRDQLAREILTLPWRRVSRLLDSVRLEALCLNLLVMHLLNLGRHRCSPLGPPLRTGRFNRVRRILAGFVFENVRSQSLSHLFLVHFILEEEVGHILALEFKLATRSGEVCSLTTALSHDILSGRLWHIPLRCSGLRRGRIQRVVG